MRCLLEEEEGVSKEVIATALMNTEADATGNKVLAEIGLSNSTDIENLSYVSDVKNTIMTSMFVMLFLWTLFLILGTMLFLYWRERLYRKSENIIKDYIEGNYNVHLPQSNEGNIYQLLASVDQLATMLQAKNDTEQKTKEFLKNTISDISHQLKTPLSALMMYQEIIENEPDNPETVKEFSLKIGTALKRIEQLIQSMLKITRIDAGSIFFEKSNYSISNILNHAISELTTRANNEKKEIVIDGDLEQMLYCDIEWTSEAIGNIVKNALDHTDAGGKITISWERTPAMIRIYITDNGHGIDQGDIHHIFKRFYRSKNTSDSQGMGKNLQEDAAPIKYLRLLLRYLEPEDKRSEWEKDVWKLENFGFEVRQNPIDVIRTIKFTGIIQETIREEVKRASYIRIKYLSVGSLQGEIRAVRRFSEFLAKRNPEIKSLGEVGRLNIEEYLTYINLERGQERNLKTEMANLKNMLQQVGKVIDKPKLGKLFIKQDMPKAPEVAFKIYSDEEIKRLNYYIVNMEEQVARALILHQMLGGRISDTLTLRTDCLYQENGHYIVRMYQVKTSYYEKPIPDDVAKLIQKSIEYTYERYGETEYVFVNESNPSLPFQYSMLKHRVYTLIHENDICKDNGERMGFATHLFRHCYGMKLVELHLDDAAIAHLLGHRGVNTVYRYRRASGKLLVKETEELRKTMDEILSEIIKEWDGYEQVFKNG